MKLRVGYELNYDFPQPTPLIGMLNIHYSRIADLVEPDRIKIHPSVRISGYRDLFGNWCSRILAPAGAVKLSTEAIVNDSGLPDEIVPDAAQIPVELLPEEAIVFLLPSRFCDSDRLLDLAWSLFGKTKPGWERVQAICDFTHQRIQFGYHFARVTRTASEAYQEGQGVCRDYAHLAVAFCRALNIPARYCTGYLGDVGMQRLMRQAISPPGSRSFSTAHGALLTRATTSRALAAFCWRAGATPPMSRSRRRSARIR